MNTDSTENGPYESKGRRPADGFDEIQWSGDLKPKFGDLLISAERRKRDYSGVVGCVLALFAMAVCMAAVWGSTHGTITKLMAILGRFGR